MKVQKTNIQIHNNRNYDSDDDEKCCDFEIFRHKKNVAVNLKKKKTPFGKMFSAA